MQKSHRHSSDQTENPPRLKMEAVIVPSQTNLSFLKKKIKSRIFEFSRNLLVLITLKAISSLILKNTPPQFLFRLFLITE